MKISLMKKGSKALALTLLSVCLSLGSSGLASAHSSFFPAFPPAFPDGGPGVYIEPETPKVTTYGTGGFILYGHHLSSTTTYTLASANLGTALCPISPALGTVTTDLEGNFVLPFTVGTITNNTINTSVNVTSVTGGITLPNPFGGGGTITLPNPLTNGTITIPNPFGGGGNATATVVVGATNTTVTISNPNPLGGSGTITLPNTVIVGTPAAITITTITGVPCIPNTYNISVQQPPTNTLYNASVTITA